MRFFKEVKNILSNHHRNIFNCDWLVIKSSDFVEFKTKLFTIII